MAGWMESWLVHTNTSKRGLRSLHHGAWDVHLTPGIPVPILIPLFGHPTHFLFTARASGLFPFPGLVPCSRPLLLLLLLLQRPPVPRGRLHGHRQSGCPPHDALLPLPLRLPRVTASAPSPSASGGRGRVPEPGGVQHVGGEDLTLLQTSGEGAKGGEEVLCLVIHIRLAIWDSSGFRFQADFLK